MVTTRRPVNRPPRSRITREAVEIFKRIRATPMQYYADAALSDALGLCVHFCTVPRNEGVSSVVV